MDANQNIIRLRVKKGFVVVGIILLIGAGFLVIERVRGAWALKQRLNQLSADGERLDVALVIPKARPFDSNAAVVLRAVTNELNQIATLIDLAPPNLRFASPGNAVVAWRLTEWRSDKKTNRWTDIRREIKTASNLLVQLHAAAEKPFFDSGFDYKKGFVDFESGPLIEVKRAAQALRVAATYELNQGNLDAAHRHLLALIQLSQQTMEPMIIWQLMRHACAILSFNEAWQFLQHPAVTEQQLQALQVALGRAEFKQDMGMALEVERAMSLDFFRQIKNSATIRDQIVAQRKGWAEPFNSFLTDGLVLQHINVPLWQFAWADQDELRTLNRWQAAIAVERQARSNGWASVATAESQSRDDWAGDALALISGEAVPNSESAFDRFRFLFSSGPFGVSDILVRKTLAVETFRNIVVTAIALKRFELRNGEHPKNLNALVPDLLTAVPIDEMDHQPLRYKSSKGADSVLYSVGENGLDDHGDSNPPRKEAYLQIWDGKDAVWPRPATPDEAIKAMKRRHY
jgi:hypothetical protein